MRKNLLLMLIVLVFCLTGCSDEILCNCEENTVIPVESGLRDTTWIPEGDNLLEFFIKKITFSADGKTITYLVDNLDGTIVDSIVNVVRCEKIPVFDNLNLCWKIETIRTILLRVDTFYLFLNNKEMKISKYDGYVFKKQE